MQICGLEGLQGARVDHIFVGQAWRVMLARVLATEPQALLLDQPTPDLDPALAHERIALLRTTTRQGGGVLVGMPAPGLASRVLPPGQSQAR